MNKRAVVAELPAVFGSLSEFGSVACLVRRSPMLAVRWASGTGWVAGGLVSRMHIVERLREWDFCADLGAAALRAIHDQRPAEGCDPVVQATEAAA